MPTQHPDSGRHDPGLSPGGGSDGSRLPRVATARVSLGVDVHLACCPFEAAPIAAFLPDNILRDGDVLTGRRDGLAPAVVVWSGSLAEREPGDPSPFSGLFDADPRTWGAAGKAALDGALSRLVPAATGLGVELWVRPHCRHAVPDQQAALHLARSLAARGVPAAGPGAVRFLLDTGSIFTAAMMPRAEDHLIRFALMLELWEDPVLRPRLAGLVLSDFSPADRPGRDPEPGVEPDLAPDHGPTGRVLRQHDGDLPPRALAGVARAFVTRFPEAWLITG